MEMQESSTRIIKETFPSEMVSIVGHFLAGIVLLILILPFKSFIILILMIPALLSLRGNISGPFISRTARDLIIGEFNVRTWLENVVATYGLSLISALIIGISSIILDLLILKIFIVSIYCLILIPLITTLLTTTFSFPISTILNYLTFKYGFTPNNVVPPIMTFLGDFFTILIFYVTLISLGVP